MTFGITLGILTALFQALSYIFMRKSLSEFPESVAFFINAVTGVMIWIPFAMLTNGVWGDVLWVLPYALLSAVLSEAFVFFALARGDTTISGVLFSTYPIFTIVIAYFALQERLVAIGVIAILLAIIGTLIVSAPSRREWLENNLSNWQFHLVMWPLIAALAVGFSDVAGKYAIDHASAGTFLIALAIAEIPVAIVFLYLQKQSLKQFKSFVTNFDDYKWAFWSGLLSTITLITFWLSFELLPASVASPLTALSPVFVFAMGITFLKERVSAKNTIGMTVVVVAVLLLSIYGF